MSLDKSNQIVIVKRKRVPAERCHCNQFLGPKTTKILDNDFVFGQIVGHFLEISGNPYKKYRNLVRLSQKSL